MNDLSNSKYEELMALLEQEEEELNHLKDQELWLEKELKDAKVKGMVLPTVKEVIVAFSLFEQGIFQQSLCHGDQPSVTQIVSNCEKRAIGSNGGFGYRSIKDGAEVALLDSIVLAHWLCHEQKSRKKQQISY